MGIVGAGTWGETHAYIYKEHANADPVAICDMNRERAQAIADQVWDQRDLYGLPGDGGESRYRRRGHRDPRLRPRRHRVLLCRTQEGHAHRKASGYHREDAERIVEAVKRNGVRCMVDLHNRWNAPFNTCKQLIEAGKLGEPYTAYIRHSDIKWCATDLRPGRPSPPSSGFGPATLWIPCGGCSRTSSSGSTPSSGRAF